MTERLIPASSRESLLWPALPGDKGRSLLSILYQLDQTQWWTSGELRQEQFRQLGSLIGHAVATVPYYRDRYSVAAAKIAANPTIEAWQDLPVLARRDVQEAGDDLRSEELPGDHGFVSEIFTSGSTGKPVHVLRTELALLFWSAFTLRDHLWHRRRLAGTLATIRNSAAGEDLYPEGRTTRYWGSSRRAFDTGPSVSLNINSTVEEQVDWLKRKKPDYLLTHPTNVSRLARYCIEEEIRLPGLRQVQTLSEILGAEVRDLCRQAWDVEVADMYTSREIGYMALQCPDHEHYHVQAEGVLLEVVDEGGRECEPGQIGRVIATPLHNFAMPLLRYDVGDFAEVGDPCPCGRGLPVLKKIYGRAQNMVTLPSGEKRWTLLSSGDIKSFLAMAPILQYQFVQQTVETILVRLVTARPLGADEEDVMRQWIVKKFGHPFEVGFEYREDLPRRASGKFEDFVSQIDAGAP